MFENLKRWFAPTRQASAGLFSLPKLILEVQPEFVSAARLDGSGRGPRPLRRMAVERLAPGSLQVAFNRPNVPAQAELHRAIRALAQVVGNGNSRLGLLIPDGTARVATLTFEALPNARREAEALVRWRMKDMLPIPPEEARLSYQVLRRDESSIELLAMAAKSSVLSEYETALEPIGSNPALILPATAAILPLLPDENGAGQLLVHLCARWATAVVVAGGSVRLWRSRPVTQSGTDELASELASEVIRILAGSGDRLNVEIARIWLCVRPPTEPEVCTELAQRISREVQPLVPEGRLGSSLPEGERALFEQFGVSVAGLIRNAS